MIHSGIVRLGFPSPSLDLCATCQRELPVIDKGLPPSRPSGRRSAVLAWVHATGTQLPALGPNDVVIQSRSGSWRWPVEGGGRSACLVLLLVICFALVTTLNRFSYQLIPAIYCSDAPRLYVWTSPHYCNLLLASIFFSPQKKMRLCHN